MRTRPFGATGLAVSELGLGAGPLGDPSVLDDAAAERLVHAALELGITLIDTAPSYGRSEQRIGHALRGRRDRVVLSTKLGYGVPGVPDWTGPCITAGIELALERLATTWLDIAHFHSCPLDVLQRSDILDALAAAQRSGKVRVAAYSGDNAPLLWAIESGLFGGVQCSVNVADQRALDRALPLAAARGLGVLAKRPLANGAWREPVRPDAPTAPPTGTGSTRWASRSPQSAPSASSSPSPPPRSSSGPPASITCARWPRPPRIPPPISCASCSAATTAAGTASSDRGGVERGVPPR
jgi:aryl-alcohol dehydrogenase-like predicted oxidoreductase